MFTKKEFGEFIKRKRTYEDDIEVIWQRMDHVVRLVCNICKAKLDGWGFSDWDNIVDESFYSNTPISDDIRIPYVFHGSVQCNSVMTDRCDYSKYIPRSFFFMSDGEISEIVFADIKETKRNLQRNHSVSVERTKERIKVISELTPHQRMVLGLDGIR